jgi:hypothetical protein
VISLSDLTTFSCSVAEHSGLRSAVPHAGERCSSDFKSTQEIDKINPSQRDSHTTYGTVSMING